MKRLQQNVAKSAVSRDVSLLLQKMTAVFRLSAFLLHRTITVYISYFVNKSSMTRLAQLVTLIWLGMCCTTQVTTICTEMIYVF